MDNELHPQKPCLVAVFMPALRDLLLQMEDEKGTPLTPQEVFAIRNQAACMRLRPEIAERIDKFRGYRDIDPENCWYDWQGLRRELGRKPDLNPGPKTYIRRDIDPEYGATINEAQKTLPQFCRMIMECVGEQRMVKTRLMNGDNCALVWLSVVRVVQSAFVTEIFEVPYLLSNYQMGDRISVLSQGVFDWMVLDRETLYGGYSIRYHRQQLEASELATFDAHIGVTRYA
ncbi:MAG: DUF2314 domain-containing protein [Cyanobacteria bacterium J06636_16]